MYIVTIPESTFTGPVELVVSSKIQPAQIGVKTLAFNSKRTPLSNDMSSEPICATLRSNSDAPTPQ